MKRGDKKGVSAVITTLLIILVSLAAIAVVWVVIKNIVSQGSEGVNLQRFSLDLAIKSAYFNGQEVDVLVKRNPGAGDLVGIYFIFHNGTGSVGVRENISLNELDERTFSFTFAAFPGIDTANLVSVAPIYMSSGKDTIGDITDTAEIRKTPPPGVGGGTGTGAVCGNSLLETGEQCDDGNTNSNDGCSSPNCQIETPSSCNNNNIVDSGEFCDGTSNPETCITLGFTGGTLSCSSCTFNTSQCTISGAVCGDNIIETGETCDDGNLNNGDGCSSTCQIETPQGPICGNLVCEQGEDSASCPQDCPAPPSCNGTWTLNPPEDPGVECDGGANCVSCSCSSGYVPDGIGGCVPEPSLNNGTVDSIWPAGAVRYFDSNDLPKDGSIMQTYIGKYTNFSGAGGETRCLRITYAEYLSDPAYDKSYIRVEATATILPGDNYEIWASPTCGA